MTAILISVIIGLIVNECSDVSPWCARKLVRWSAYRCYADAGLAAAKAEELAALVDDRPGKLLKLFTALGFASSAVLAACQRTLTRTKLPARELPQDLPVVTTPPESPGRRDFGRWTPEADRVSHLARQDRAHARGATYPLPRRTPRPAPRSRI
jgi:hypothetical protein